jgi:hypothetical protein
VPVCSAMSTRPSGNGAMAVAAFKFVAMVSAMKPGGTSVAKDQ